eukprot:1783592-Prymnesium_polylepis.1
MGHVTVGHVAVLQVHDEGAAGPGFGVNHAAAHLPGAHSHGRAHVRRMRRRTGAGCGVRGSGRVKGLGERVGGEVPR